MDFLDPKKRRRHDIQLLLGYVLVGVAILMATTVLIYYANGFGVSRDGSLVQRGLVYVSSQPAGSDLYVNGKKKTQTNTKLNLAVGRYNLTIKRTGYINWARNIIVEGSSVDHYTYPLLLPKTLDPTTLTSFSAQPIVITQSPDKRWLVLQSVPGDTFQAFDLKKNQTEVGIPEPFDVPAGLLTPSLQPATWKVVDWAANNRHILMQRSFTDAAGAQKEYVLVDTQRPDGSHNLTREFALIPTQQLSLRDKDPELYYIYTPETALLSTAELDNAVAEIFQTNVLAFKPYGKDVLLYATNDGASEGEARIILRDETKSYFIRTVSRSDSYLLDLARYDSDWFVAAGSAKDQRVFYYRNPVESIGKSSGGRPTPIFVFRMNTPNKLAFSANAQFIALQNGTDVYVYDNEFERAYQYAAPAPIDGPEKYATWLDGHRLVYVSGGKQVVVDYDGINFRSLVQTDAAVGGFFDRDNRYLYTFSTSDGATGPQLVSTPLRTPEDL